MSILNKKSTHANQSARLDVQKRAQTNPSQSPPSIQIIGYINTVHESIDVQDIYEFANKAMSSGGNLTYLYPFADFDEGVALIYKGGPANQEVLQRAFLDMMGA